MDLNASRLSIAASSFLLLAFMGLEIAKLSM